MTLGSVSLLLSAALTAQSSTTPLAIEDPPPALPHST
jgi:hypothetical protein